MTFEINRAVDLLVKNGYNVLAVDLSNSDKVSYFVVKDFNPAYKSSVESIDYCKFTGVDLTDYISANHLNLNEAGFISTFMIKFENAPVITCKFSLHFKWVYWES